jgi:hypothetical protein
MVNTSTNVNKIKESLDSDGQLSFILFILVEVLAITV